MSVVMGGVLGLVLALMWGRVAPKLSERQQKAIEISVFSGGLLIGMLIMSYFTIIVSVVMLALHLRKWGYLTRNH